MIKHGEPNPLNIFMMRSFTHCAPHLERVYFDTNQSDTTILNWIIENLEGRFYYGDHLIKNADNNWEIRKCAAFEIKSEASYFCFMLDKIGH